jgi:hypothetical protein
MGKPYRPTKITSTSSVFRIKQALTIILWMLSTEDLKYLHDLKNWVGNLDFVGVVIDEIITARTIKQQEIYNSVIKHI